MKSNNYSAYKLPNLFYDDHSTNQMIANYNRNLRAITERNTRRISLMDYIKEAWPIIEPGKEFISNWSIEAIAEHLEAVSKGQIHRLLISVPPRHMKSLICSVFWPTWEWTWKPTSQWITTSYGLGLSIGFATKSRRLINSAWYQKHWGHVFQLNKDQNSKSRYINNLEGQRFATAMLASVLGENADRIVIDDPHNAQEIDSDLVREATLEAYNLGFSTRLNDAKKGAIVQVAQRLREDDLSAHLLSLGFEHLVLPSEYDPDTKCTTKISRKKKIDPRTSKGQLLWPTRFDQDTLKQYKRVLGAYGYAAQHDQRPTPAGGALFKEKDIRANPFISPDLLNTVKFKRKHRHWDLAATVNATSDYTASVLLGVTYDDKYIILDVTREKLTPGDFEKFLLNVALSDGYDVSISIEEEKGASGKHTTDHYRRNILKGFDCRPQPLWSDKVSRARAFVGQVESHNVYLVAADWNHEFIAELTRFPKSAHKDQVDAASGAFREVMASQYSNLWDNLKPSTNNQIPNQDKQSKQVVINNTKYTPVKI
jgi:predicted phage terminase large subunit-like protein